MAERKPNEIKRIAWHLVAKNLLKFVDDEQSYKLTDKVLAANDFVKYPLMKGSMVEVGIVDNTITYLRKQKSEAPKQESHGSEEAYEPTPEEEAPKPAPAPKVEPEVKKESPTIAGEVRELTVYAVSGDKRVVKFTEIKDEGWFDIADDIKAMDYTKIGLTGKSKVKVQIVEKKVISIVKVNSEPAEQAKTPTSSSVNAKVEPTPIKEQVAPVATPTAVSSPKKEWKPISSYDTAEKQVSIECQAMINSACTVVGMVASSISPAPTASVINNMIRAIAEESYQLLQELKKKQ